MKSKGVGDTIDKITTATGIKKAVKWVFGDSCGCEERRQWLNEKLPYKTHECLTEEEYMWCKGYFNTFRNVIARDEQHKLLEIYNRVFKKNKQTSSCSSCVKDLYNQVKQLFDAYEESEQEHQE